MSWWTVLPKPEMCVQVYISPECPNSDSRIELSSGTRNANEDEDSVVYEHNARVPREPWRAPTKQELALLLSNSAQSEPGRSVSVLRLPELGCSGSTQGRQDLKLKVFDWLRQNHEIGEKVTFVGPIGNAPDLSTTTKGDSGRTFIGLHVDSWHNADLDRRGESDSRICINLGRSARYFLFIPIPMVEIGNIMSTGLGSEAVRTGSVSDLGRMFTEQFQDVPVVRCRIEPNEAYIAATENLVHDGSSKGSMHLDRQLTILGRIAIRR